MADGDVAPLPVAGEENGDVRVATGHTTVLVIDDDADARDFMRRFLSREGFDVITADGGAKGLEAARRHGPALITLDVLMPDMDGWSVLQALKGDPDLRAIPVIMLTIVDEKHKGIALGASEYMNKPVDRGRLRQVLDRLRRGDAEFHVLVIEDDAPTREVLRRLLLGENCRVSEAENGRVGLERLDAGAPDLILLDLMMPEMDGFEFLAAFRQLPGHEKIPVIVVTAADLSKEDHRRLNSGVVDVLLKTPDAEAELMAELGNLIRSHRFGAGGK